MRRITKFDDADVLEAALEIVTALGGLNVAENIRLSEEHVGARADAARAAVDFAYRKTEDCERHCEEYLGIAV